MKEDNTLMEKFGLEMLEKSNVKTVDMNKIYWQVKYLIWKLFRKGAESGK